MKQQQRKSRPLICLLLLTVFLLFGGCAGSFPEAAEGPEAANPDDSSPEISGSENAAQQPTTEEAGQQLRFICMEYDRDRLVQELIEQNPEQNISLSLLPREVIERRQPYAEMLREELRRDDLGVLILNPALLNTYSQALSETAELAPEVPRVVCDPGTLSPQILEQADLLLQWDYTAQVRRMMEIAVNDMQATALVYYTYSRFRDDPDFSGVYRTGFDTAEQVCGELGIDFVPVVIPDELGADAYFILDRDIPQKVEEYGVNTAFYSDGWNMQTMLYAKALELGAIVASPGIPESQLSFLREENATATYSDAEIALRKQLQEKEVNGRLADFPVDGGWLETQAIAAYCQKWLDGELSPGEIDLPTMEKILEELCGGDCYLHYYEQDGVTYENCLLYSLEPIIIK